MGIGWLTARNGAASRAQATGPATGRRLSLPFAAQGFVVLVCVALLALTGLQAWQNRKAHLREAGNTNANLARALVQQAEDTFGVADAILVSLAERFEREGAWPASLAGIEQQMVAHVTEAPRISGLFLYGEDGGWLASSMSSIPAVANNSDREYFKHHRAHADRGAYLGQPVLSRSRGIWIVTVSRRLQHPDGSFAGVVLATVNAEHFAGQYREFDVGPKGSVTLFRREGVLLSRFPFDEAQMGRSFAGQRLFREQLPRSPRGSYQFVSPIDGVGRVAGYHSGRSFPVVVIVASAVEDVLVGWTGEVAEQLAIITPIIALLAWLGTRLARQARRRQIAEQALGESELQFRLLTEMSSDMVTRIDVHGVRRYVSPASARVLGRAPEELVGGRCMTPVHPEDLGATTEVLDALAAGTVRDDTIAYRTWHKDGREVWLEANFRVTRDAETGAVNGAVVISRDITVRKVVETKLARLATTDGLTGLANRRRLDEALASEWRRAARDGTAVSFALMDVDRFKLFNDRYGHGAGDECLRRVAAALAGTAQRPADLVARYGGEELAALLPGTESRGAGEVAEIIRAAIQGLGISHADSPPAGVVTVSIGVATAVPVGGEDPAAGVRHLLAAADAALYEAKRMGRNRVVVAPPMPAGAVLAQAGSMPAPAP